MYIHGQIYNNPLLLTGIKINYCFVVLKTSSLSIVPRGYGQQAQFKIQQLPRQIDHEELHLIQSIYFIACNFQERSNLLRDHFEPPSVRYPGFFIQKEKFVLFSVHLKIEIATFKKNLKHPFRLILKQQQETAKSTILRRQMIFLGASQLKV